MKLNNNDDSHNSGLNLLIYNMLLDIESHPTWVCGLKHGWFWCRLCCWVTPYVGVWIETVSLKCVKCKTRVTPYVGVWIETMSMEVFPGCTIVTPYVGVWIETYQYGFYKARPRSHPTWVCGLKHGCVIYINCMRSHTLRGCVD